MDVKWSYLGSVGPAHWGMLSPAFELCDTGRAQAPINIGRNKTRSAYALKIHYPTTPLVIGKDIETALEVGSEKLMINDGHSLQLNFPSKNNRERIAYQGDKYNLVQIHFHSPSETTWHKQSFPLEIHFVHQGKDGKVVVLAVLVKGGEKNSVLQTILDHLPAEQGRVFNVPHTNIRPAQLLPADKRYYAYNGSLTVPPCTEGVQWIVMPKAITATPAQISSIREAIGGNNARPEQALNSRVLSYANK
tara:strand:- start:233 stop:976 length:744 start_codon:yes stop_codon:yes gene_type:complete